MVHEKRLSLNFYRNRNNVVSDAIRSGHRQVYSTNAYLIIRGSLGKRQQQELLPDVSSKTLKGHTSDEI